MSSRSRTRAAIAILGAGALITASALLLNGSLSGDAPPIGAGHAYLDNLPDASATSFASRAIAGGEHCGSVTHAASAAPVPAPYRWCTYGSAVEYVPVKASTGLWYQEYSGLPQAPQVCVKYLGRHWWAISSEDSRDVVHPCPVHYTLTSGA